VSGENADFDEKDSLATTENYKKKEVKIESGA
jgi:hypothetical protein